MFASDTPSCVWRVDAALVEALETHLGPPLDSYVRGWQTWLEPHGPGGATIEWRLHPPAGFVIPDGLDPTDLFDLVLQAVAEAETPNSDALPVESAALRLSQIWEVLEAFPAHGDAVGEPQELAEACAGALGGRHPDAVGWVDHDRLGDLYKAADGDFSVGTALLEQLSSPD